MSKPKKKASPDLVKLYNPEAKYYENEKNPAPSYKGVGNPQMNRKNH